MSLESRIHCLGLTLVDHWRTGPIPPSEHTTRFKPEVGQLLSSLSLTKNLLVSIDALRLPPSHGFTSVVGTRVRLLKEESPPFGYSEPGPTSTSFESPVLQQLRPKRTPHPPVKNCQPSTRCLPNFFNFKIWSVHFPMEFTGDLSRLTSLKSKVQVRNPVGETYCGWPTSPRRVFDRPV